jgi:very-long-chain enoyl-CoA reductase
MVLIHYLKREYETIYVHRFSLDTMPWTNIFKNSTHYWVFFGLFNMYFFLHPDYTAPTWATDAMHYIFFTMFLTFEFLNFQCHCVLRDLRKPGTTTRGIPKGWGFGYVSCANYFFEALCWLVFALQAQVLGAYFFLAVSFFQMLDWAIKKHKRYRKEFKEDYKTRYAMVPFVI